jgi:hypothetical protein
VAVEQHAEHVVRLALVEVGRRVDVGDGDDVRVRLGTAVSSRSRRR